MEYNNLNEYILGQFSNTDQDYIISMVANENFNFGDPILINEGDNLIKANQYYIDTVHIIFDNNFGNDNVININIKNQNISKSYNTNQLTTIIDIINALNSLDGVEALYDISLTDPKEIRVRTINYDNDLSINITGTISPSIIKNFDSSQIRVGIAAFIQKTIENNKGYVKNETISVLNKGNIIVKPLDTAIAGYKAYVAKNIITGEKGIITNIYNQDYKYHNFIGIWQSNIFDDFAILGLNGLQRGSISFNFSDLFSYTNSFFELQSITKPTTSIENKVRLYAKNVNGILKLFYLRPNGVEIEIGSGGSGGTANWGEIEGLLSNQTDLQIALNDKANLNRQENKNLYANPNGNDTTGTGALNNPYKTWQKAIDMATSGDIVNVSGTTTENLTINKSITLLGKAPESNSTSLIGNITFGTTGNIFTPIHNIYINGDVTTTGLGGWRLKDCIVTGNVTISGILTNNIEIDRSSIRGSNITITALNTQDIQIKNGWYPTELIINSGFVIVNEVSTIKKVTLNAGLLVLQKISAIEKDSNGICLSVNATASNSEIYLIDFVSLRQTDTSFGKIKRLDASKNVPIYVLGDLIDNPTLHELYTTPLLPGSHLGYRVAGYPAPIHYSIGADILAYHLAGIDAALTTTGGASEIEVERLTINTDGQTAFTLVNIPANDKSVLLFLNGNECERGVEFTTLGTSLTWLNPGGLTLKTTDILVANIFKTAVISDSIPLSYLDIDVTLSANSNAKVPSQKATKSYVDAGLSGKSNTDHTHTKGDIGLSNVDNTSDANKPISSATQTALNDKISGTLTSTKILVSDGIKSVKDSNITDNNILVSISKPLQINDGAGQYLQIPKLTATQRNALTPIAGMQIYNTTSSQIQGYNGTTWISLEISKIKEVFFIGSDYTITYRGYRAKGIGATSLADSSFIIPSDFSSIISFKANLMIATGAAGSNKNIDLTSQYCQIGEPYNQHSETDITTTYDFTGYDDKFYDLNVAGVFTLLTAEDRCSLNITTTAIGGSIYLLGFTLKYNVI